GREFHEDAEGRGRLFDELRNVRGCHRRSSQLHRRGLQHTQTTLSARLLEPRAIRGPLRSANGQNCRLILSSPRGPLHFVDWFNPWSNIVDHRDATPIRYWIIMGVHITIFCSCLVVAIFGWWHPNT